RPVNPLAPKTIPQAIANAMTRAGLQAASFTTGLTGVSADVVGADDTALELVRTASALQEKTKNVPAMIPSFEDIESWSDVPIYTLEAVIENGLSFAMSAGGAFAGRKVGEVAVKNQVDNLVAAAAKRELKRRGAVV